METRSGSIILVDANATTREALAARLRAQGYVVDTAPDGATQDTAGLNEATYDGLGRHFVSIARDPERERHSYAGSKE